MKIEDCRKNLGELKVGTVFENHNTIYLKTDRLYDKELRCATCVDLATGNTFGIDKNSMVNVVEAKLVIDR